MDFAPKNLISDELRQAKQKMFWKVLSVVHFLYRTHARALTFEKIKCQSLASSTLPLCLESVGNSAEYPLEMSDRNSLDALEVDLKVSWNTHSLSHTHMHTYVRMIHP
jgi:hypothetical protein